MNRQFEDVLDDKLCELLAGSKPSVAPYPSDSAEADELTGLLAVAAQLTAVGHPEPSPAGVVMGRQRLLRAIEERQARSERSPWGVWSWLRPVFSGALVTAFCLALLFGVNVLAAKSVPGNPLYFAKTVKERVQLLMANTPREQADLHLLLALNRLYELQSVALNNNAPNLALVDATTQEIDAALAAMQNVPVTQIGPLLSDLARVARRQQSTLLWVQRRSPADTQPAIAQALLRAHDVYRVATEAQSQGLAAVQPPQALPEVAAIVEFKGPVVSEGESVLGIGSHEVVLSDLTEINGKASLGSAVEVRAARLSDGSLIALNVRQTAAPVEGVWVRVNGKITGAYDSTWLINERPVIFDSQTNLVGWLVPGATADVRGVLRADGTVLARDVEVDGQEAALTVTGPVVERSPEKWIVGDVGVEVDTATYLDESNALAAESQGASVRAVRSTDGTLVARSITPLKDAPPASVAIHDTVSSRVGNVWTIGSWTVVVDEATEISSADDPVGSVADVSVAPASDGTLHASKIVIEPKPAAKAVRISFEGAAAWTDGALEVAGRPVSVTTDSKVYVGDRAVTGFKPATGRTVDVDGWLDPSGVVVAETIRVQQAGDQVEVTGAIRNLAGDHFELDGTTVYLDGGVEVVASEGSAGLGDLREGLVVTVVGEAGEDGALLASTIRIGPDIAGKGDAPGPKNEPQPGNPKGPATPAEPTPQPTPPGQAKPKDNPGGAKKPATPTPAPTDTPEPTQEPAPSATPTPWPTIVVKPKDGGGKPGPVPPTPTTTPQPPEPTATPESTDTPVPGPGGPGEPPATPTPGPGGPGGFLPTPVPNETPDPTITPVATLWPGIPRPLRSPEPLLPVPADPL